MPCRPDTLASTLSRHVPLSNRWLETLVVLVLGLVCGRTVNLSHIAGHFRGPAQLTSNYRRLQRFFQFVRLDEDWLARTLVALLNLRPPFQLCLDRTNWKLGVKDVNLLVLCIAARRVRIPILWTVLDGSGGSSMEDRMTLMERYLAIFGVASIGMLLADREFIGNQWFEFLVKNKIPFAIRVKENLIVILEDGRMASLASLTRRRPSRRQLAAYKGRFEGMQQRFAGTLCFAAKRRNDGTMIIIATNCEPNGALAAYKRRWQIECLFGDTKTRGLNMEDTKLTQPAKLSLLMAVVALALAWAHACASATKGHANIARASHGYRRKSWFRTGFDALRHWIASHPDRASDLWRSIWNRPKPNLLLARVV